MSKGYQRRRILFSGRVQGVGFRYTAQRIAQAYPVTGFVRNLDDGRVELVAEGEPAELDRFQDEVCSVMEDYIRDVEAVSSPATGQFDSFQIAH